MAGNPQPYMVVTLKPEIYCSRILLCRRALAAHILPPRVCHSDRTVHPRVILPRSPSVEWTDLFEMTNGVGSNMHRGGPA